MAWDKADKTLEDLVNQRGTKLWTQMNDNSKASKKRDLFVAQYGGFFKQEGRSWVWVSPITSHNGYWLKRVDTGEKTFFTSMADFAKAQGMTSNKICELLNGKRKTYKGWTAVELRPVKDSVAPNIKLKAPKKKQTRSTKTVTFVDLQTNTIFTVNNLSQFAKNNSLDYGKIKKLANGKCKTYKNLKLYNPLEQYKESPEPK
jgi:hypothetical protein